MVAQLYLVSPPQIKLTLFAPLLRTLLEQKVVSVFQLRLKDIPEADLIDACNILIPICHDHNVPFILNDNAKIAAEVHADGVHLGEEADNYQEARALLGSHRTIGISCYDSIDRAMNYASKGADYVSFGAFYPTTTKIAKANPAPAILNRWTKFSTVPCVAIGGITPQNAPTLIQEGADFIAVISAIWQHPVSPEIGLKEFKEIL